LLPLGDRSDFVGLKLRRSEAGDFFIIEAAAQITRFFQPAIAVFQPIRSTRTIADLFKDTTGPSIYTAIQQQLGLKLESGKDPVAVLIIDHVERPSEN
jgi:hypothetical protein